MRELNQKKTVRPAATNKPKHVPFSINTQSLASSPAYKRKASPISHNSSINNENLNPSAKKRFEFDPVEKENNVSNPIVIKDEPIELNDDIDDQTLIESMLSTSTTTFKSIKKETKDQEAFENMELLSQLNEMNLDTTQIKSEPSTEALNVKNHDKFLFYWLDAFEDQYNSTGSIYLFGKTPILKQNNELQFVSVCLVVKNIPKMVHVLPRKGAAIEQVTAEIQTLLAKNKINQFKLKTVKKIYAFDKHIGAKQDELISYESDYLQVEYIVGVNKHVLAETEGETFSCIFNTQTAYLEHFLIELRLKGPCWLQINNSIQNSASLSWCKLEYTVDNYRNIAQYKETHLPDNSTTCSNCLFRSFTV